LFTNSSEYTPLFVSALHDIGCPEVAELTEQAIAALGIEGPITTEAIDRVMEEENGEREARLSEYDRQYFEVAGDLAGPLFEFIKSKRDKISLT
jgi:hypothetical protein